MRKNKIIQPGKVCTLDPNNELKQKDTGVIHVEVIKRVVKYKFGGGSLWLTRNIITGETYIVPERLLYPEGTVCIRYPADLPVFNNHDIDILYRMITEFEKIKRGESNKFNITEAEFGHLKTLLDKVTFAISLRGDK